MYVYAKYIARLPRPLHLTALRRNYAVQAGTPPPSLPSFLAVTWFSLPIAAHFPFQAADVVVVGFWLGEHN